MGRPLTTLGQILKDFELEDAQSELKGGKDTKMDDSDQMMLVDENGDVEILDSDCECLRCSEMEPSSCAVSPGPSAIDAVDLMCNTDERKSFSEVPSPPMFTPLTNLAEVMAGVVPFIAEEHVKAMTKTPLPIDKDPFEPSQNPEPPLTLTNAPDI